MYINSSPDLNISSYSISWHSWFIRIHFCSFWLTRFFGHSYVTLDKIPGNGLRPSILCFIVAWLKQLSKDKQRDNTSPFEEFIILSLLNNGTNIHSYRVNWLRNVCLDQNICLKILKYSLQVPRKPFIYISSLW